MKYIELIDYATRAMNSAYSPYSEFKVGATLLCADGSVYTGCNIENASFGATCCAERVALFEAVKSGKREFESICIVGGKDGEITDYCSPCGICRQVLSEFCKGDFKIILYNGTDVKEYTLEELLPMSFSGDEL